METHTQSPELTAAATNNNDSDFLTPEQDNGVSVATILGGPKKSNKIRAPILKSKVDSDAASEDKLPPNYAIVHSNRGKGILKNKQNKSPKNQKPHVVVPKPVQVQKPSVPRTTTTSIPKQNGPSVPSEETKLKITKMSSLHQPTAVPPKPSSKSPIPFNTMKKIVPPKHAFAFIVQPKPPEKDKYYDPATIKSFMEQQREVRRLREKQEQREKQREVEQKQFKLKTLDLKRKEQIAKTRFAAKPPENQSEHLSRATKIYRARKAKSKSPPPPAAKSSSNSTAGGRIKKAQVAKDDGMYGKKAEAAAELRTTMLLQEFENIVHNEISVLKLKGSEPVKPRGEKAVETAFGLYERKPKQSTSKDKGQSDEIRNKAATTIQAAYRGYRHRKIWREVMEDRSQRPPRRISFYRARTPEIRNRRLPLITNDAATYSQSQPNVQKSAFGLPLEFSPYIPPPPNALYYSPSSTPTSSPNPRNPAYLQFQPVSVLGSKERRRSRRFEEPFPKEAIKQLNEQSPTPMSPAGSDHFMRRDLTSPVVNMAQVTGIASLLHPQIPPFSMVLKEKVRLLMEKQNAAMTTPRKSNSHVPGDILYDSDSTQHASILLSSRRQSAYESSSEPTITDDYIGPDEEAMKLAYNLRKSPRIFLEAGRHVSEPERKKTKTFVDVEMDDDNDSSFVSNQSSISSGMDTEEESFVHRRRDFNRNANIPSSIADFRLKVTERRNKLMDKAVRASMSAFRHQNLPSPLASEQKSSQRQDHLDRWAQVAMTQAESIKTTAEVNQWLLEMHRSSLGPEYRKTEMANLAELIVGAVEETKAKVNQPTQQNQNRVFLHAQEAQTTDSLYQKDINYSEDEFLETSLDLSKEISNNVEDSEREETRNSSIDQLANLTIDDEESEFGIKASESLVHIPEDQVKIVTMADVLREAQAGLQMRNFNGHSEKSVASHMVSPRNTEKLTNHDESSSLQISDKLTSQSPISVRNAETLSIPETEAQQFEKSHDHVSISEKQDDLSPSSTKILEVSANFESSLEHSEKSIDSSPISVKEPEVDQTISQAEISPLKQSKSSAKEPISAAFEFYSNDSSFIPDEESQSAVQKAESFLEEVKTDTEVLSKAEESHLSSVSSEKSSEVEESKDTLEASIHSEVEKTDISKLLSSVHESASSAPKEVPESKEDDITLHFSAPPESVEAVAEEEPESTHAPSSPKSTEIIEKNTLEESIASEADQDLSYQSDFIESVSEKLETPQEEEKSGKLEETSAQISAADFKSADENLESQQHISTEAESESEEAEDEEKTDDESTPMHRFQKHGRVLLKVSRTLDDLWNEGLIPLPLDMNEHDDAEPSTDATNVDQEETDEKSQAVIEEELKLEHEAAADMMELARYQEEHRVPEPKRITKWCVRHRDIVDHVLVGEISEDNREWTDYRQEEAVVKETLVNSVIRRAVHETLKSISEVIKK